MITEPKRSSPLLAALVASRQQLAIGLVVAGMLLGSLSVWWGIWGFARSESISPEKADGKLIPDDFSKPADEKKVDDKPKKSPDYQLASIWAGSVALVAFLSAVWLFTQPVDPVAPETAARKEVLFFGGTLGFLTALCGAFLGYRWHQSLVKWVASDDAGEAKWVLYAVAVFFAGLMIMFVSIQLARSEERTNAGLRRVLYGFNSVFVGLLLLLVLVAVNIVSFIRLPTTLVTNDSAFTELADESKRFLGSLDRPVQVYLIMPENYSESLGRNAPTYDNLYADCRGFLVQCEDYSKKFKATFLSPGFDDARIAALMDRLKVAQGDRDQFGMLAVVGENEDATAFIRATELIDMAGRSLVFQGENKLMTELMYLTDARAKEKVYFTQDHGELSMEAGAERDKSASGIVQFLRDRKMNVEPLTFNEPGAKVPDDASVVVVAGLRRTLAPDDPMVVGLREYLRRPNRPGKLLVCLPAFRNPQGRVGLSGLEALMSEYGVEADPTHRIMSLPGVLNAPPDYTVVAPYRIEGELSRVVGQLLLVLKDARPISAVPNAPGGMYRVSPMMGTNLPTWQEEDYSTSPALAIQEFRNEKTGPAAQVAKKFTRRPISVAVGVLETSPGGSKPVQKPKMIVFGSETYLQDEGPVLSGAEESRQQFFSDSIDWLRERDASIGIPPRKLGIFALEKPIDGTSQIMLMALVTLGIVAFGVSVWLSRRR